MVSLPGSCQFILSVLVVMFVVICGQLAPSQVDDIGDGETDPVKLFERGQNAHARNDLVTALALYEAALKLRPEFPEAEFQRGVALAALDRKADTEKAFTRAIELRTDGVLPYDALANLLTNQSRDKEAEPFLRRALQLGAKDFSTLDALSAVRFRAGDTKEALALAQRATEDENASASAWAWRASIEDAAGNP